jgi:hypothetical protein
MMEVTCDQCGDKFERKRSIQNQFDSTLCSRKCNSKFLSEQYSGENSHEWEGGMPESICPVCDEKFTHSIKEQTCCSPDCADEYREWPSGEDHPNWKSNSKSWPSYGSRWHKQRRKARERDGCCQVCALPSWAYRSLHGRAMDVHHIIPFEDFDDPQEANRLSNLMTLCASCHNIVERSV